MTTCLHQAQMNPRRRRCHPTMLTLFWTRLGASAVGWWRHSIKFPPEHTDGSIHCTPPPSAVKQLITAKRFFSLFDICCLSSPRTPRVGFMTPHGCRTRSAFHSSCKSLTDPTAPKQEVSIYCHHVTNGGFRAFTGNTPTTSTAWSLTAAAQHKKTKNTSKNTIISLLLEILLHF